MSELVNIVKGDFRTQQAGRYELTSFEKVSAANPQASMPSLWHFASDFLESPVAYLPMITSHYGEVDART